jgi:hypothetical protein
LAVFGLITRNALQLIAWHHAELKGAPTSSLNLTSFIIG